MFQIIRLQFYIARNLFEHLLKLRLFINRWQHNTPATYPTLLTAGCGSIVVPVLLLLLLLFLRDQKIRVYKFWGKVHQGASVKNSRTVIIDTHYHRVHTGVAKRDVLTHHLDNIHVSHTITINKFTIRF